jgi:hypothetical protein
MSAKEAWLEIVERVAEDAVKLAILRHGLSVDPDADPIGDDEIVKDVIACLTGADIGCRDEEELDDPDLCAGAFVRCKLAELLKEKN